MKRAVVPASRVSLKLTDKSVADLTLAVSADWTHDDVPLDTARELLDSYLNLTVITPWDYRRGVSYFLRTQADYQDYFQISKFQKGQDSQWKPYLAHLLGLNSTDIQKKYTLDTEIETLERAKDERQAEVQITEEDSSRFEAALAVKESELATLAAQLDAFDFREEESLVNKEVVEQIERRTALLNEQLYKHTYDIA